MRDKEKTIVYGVAQGEYSDYMVCAIFSSRKKAMAWLHAQKHHCRHCVVSTERRAVMHTEGEKKGKWCCEHCGGEFYQPGMMKVERFDFNPS